MPTLDKNTLPEGKRDFIFRDKNLSGFGCRIRYDAKL